jgi:hypothetical protein
MITSRVSISSLQVLYEIIFSSIISNLWIYRYRYDFPSTIKKVVNLLRVLRNYTFSVIKNNILIILAFMNKMHLHIKVFPVYLMFAGRMEVKLNQLIFIIPPVNTTSGTIG